MAFVGARDDRWKHALDVLVDYTSEIIVTTFNQESDEMPKVGMVPGEIAEYLRLRGKACVTEPDLAKAYHRLLERPEPLLLVTGSLYMLDDVCQLIRGS